MTAFRLAPLAREHLMETVALVARYHEELARHDPLLEAEGDALGFYRLVIERALTDESYHLVLALDPATAAPIGFVSWFETEEAVFREPRRAHISDLYVAPEWRRRGVGRALLDAALERLRAYGARTVQLSCYVSNEAGRAFWEAAGFAPYMVRMRRPV